MEITYYTLRYSTLYGGDQIWTRENRKVLCDKSADMKMVQNGIRIEKIENSLYMHALYPEKRTYELRITSHLV